MFDEQFTLSLLLPQLHAGKYRPEKLQIRTFLCSEGVFWSPGNFRVKIHSMHTFDMIKINSEYRQLISVLCAYIVLQNPVLWRGWKNVNTVKSEQFQNFIRKEKKKTCKWTVTWDMVFCLATWLYQWTKQSITEIFFIYRSL